MDKNVILKNIEDLSNNAMFAMSQTSKELFHSNFWAWLLRKYPKIFTKVFYPKYDGKSKVEVFREKSHFDLMLKIDDEFIIIENKFKSMPSKEQLDKYYEKIKDNKKKIVIISYFKPLFHSTLFDMEYISYETLSRRLQSAFHTKSAATFGGNNWFTINDYIVFLELLNKFQNCIEIQTSDKIGDLYSVAKDKEIQDKLSEINFSKTFERILMTKLTEKVLAGYDNKEFVDKIYIDCGRDLKVYSDILFYFKGAWDKCESNRHDLCYLGISLWGNFYRRYAGLHKKQCGISNAKNGRHDKENKNAGYKYLLEKYNWFFKDNNNWGGYSYDNEMYLYQKIDISELTVEELVTMAIDDLELLYKRVKCQD